MKMSKETFKKLVLTLALYLLTTLLVEIDAIWNWYGYNVRHAVSITTDAPIYIYTPVGYANHDNYYVAAVIYIDARDRHYVCNRLGSDTSDTLRFCTEVPDYNRSFCVIHSESFIITKILGAMSCTFQLAGMGSRLEYMRYMNEREGLESLDSGDAP